MTRRARTVERAAPCPRGVVRDPIPDFNGNGLL